MVRDVRTAFQYTLRHEFTDAIRQLTGRETQAFISQIDWEADVAVEVFVFKGDVTDVTQENGAAS
jgi:uncharacterized protein YbcI